MAKKIYRGYEIEERETGVWVSKDGEGRHFESEWLAMGWIDNEKKAAFKASQANTPSIKS